MIGAPVLLTRSSAHAAGATTITPGGAVENDRDNNDNNDNGDDGDSDDNDSDDDGVPADAHGISSSSRSSSDGARGTGLRDLAWRYIIVRAADRLAPPADAYAVFRYGSTVSRCADSNVRCHDPRNRHEVDTIAVMMDCMRAQQIDLAMEIGYRRLLGVEAADAALKTKKKADWTLAAMLDVTRPGELLPMDLQRVLMRDLQRYKAAHNITDKAAPSSSSSSATAPGTGGQWHGGGGGKKKKKEKKGSNNNNNNNNNNNGGNNNGGGASSAAAKS